MKPPTVDKIEQHAAILAGEIEKLDQLGLTFAASLVRIAHLELLMRIHQVDREEFDVLNFAINAVEQERRARTSSPSDKTHSQIAQDEGKK